MRNLTHPEALGYDKTQPPTNAAAAVFPDSECNHRFGVPRLTDLRQRSPENKIRFTGAAVPGGLGRDTGNPDRTSVLAVLRATYRAARCELQRIEADLDLLVGIARAVEAEIYDPAFALERAVEHGLVACADAEAAS